MYLGKTSQKKNAQTWDIVPSLGGGRSSQIHCPNLNFIGFYTFQGAKMLVIVEGYRLCSLCLVLESSLSSSELYFVIFSPNPQPKGTFMATLAMAAFTKDLRKLPWPRQLTNPPVLGKW